MDLGDSDKAPNDSVRIETENTKKDNEKEPEQNAPISMMEKRKHGENDFRKKRAMDNYNSRTNKKVKSYHFGDNLTEVEVGITEFVSKYEGFRGIIKDKYSDFHVHEIAPDGEITKLTTFSVAEFKKPAVDIKELKASIPESTAKEVEKFLEDERQDLTLEIDATDIDKATRTSIHQIAKTVPGIVSSTQNKDDKKFIIMSKKKAKKDFKVDKRVNWRNQDGEYTYFVLHKVNVDTVEALSLMAQKMRLPQNVFTFAGTKDRRAKTSQWVCLRKGNPSALTKCSMGLSGIWVGNTKFMKEPLKLGKLYGNRFTIVLRNVSAENDHLDLVMASLRDKGFINYFGLQRFGNFASIPTHEIGKALLQGNYQEAANLVLKPRANENDETLARARKIFQETNDAEAALKVIDRLDKIEAKLLKGMTICGMSDLQGSFDHIPRSIRLMYTHAYQSLVWNRLVSRRLKEFGDKPIVGDLVFVEPESNENDEVPDDEEEQKKDKSAEEKTSVDEKMIIDDQLDVKNEDKDAESLPKVKALTAEDLGNYKLSDVVFPLPGWKVQYPSYAESWFKEQLGEDGLKTNLKHINKKYSLGGAYRKILQIPCDLVWRTMKYKDPSQELVMGDYEVMKNYPSPRNDPEGQYKALIIQMTLKSSSYATMALREILKKDTSAQKQAAQSAYFAALHKDD